LASALSALEVLGRGGRGKKESRLIERGEKKGTKSSLILGQ